MNPVLLQLILFLVACFVLIVPTLMVDKGKNGEMATLSFVIVCVGALAGGLGYWLCLVGLAGFLALWAKKAYLTQEDQDQG